MHEVDELALFLSPGQSGCPQVTVPGLRAEHEGVAGAGFFPVPPGAGVAAGHQGGFCEGGLTVGAPRGGADKPGVKGEGVLAGEEDPAHHVEGGGSAALPVWSEPGAGGGDRHPWPPARRKNRCQVRSFNLWRITRCQV